MQIQRLSISPKLSKKGEGRSRKCTFICSSMIWGQLLN